MSLNEETMSSKASSTAEPELEFVGFGQPYPNPVVDSPVRKRQFVLAGLNNNWDLDTSPVFTAVDGDRDIYCCNFKTIMPEECFQVVDRAIGWSCRYYPQGNGALPLTRALEGKLLTWLICKAHNLILTTTFLSCHVLPLEGDEIRGHGHGWKIVSTPAGSEITVYFSPLEQTLALKMGAFDSSYMMPQRMTSLTADDIVAATHFEIVGEHDVISKAMVMAADPFARWVIATFHIIPMVTMVFLTMWVSHTAFLQMQVNLYNSGSPIEWAVVIIIYIAVFLPKLFGMKLPCRLVFELIEMASKVNGNQELAWGLRIAAGEMQLVAK